MLIVGAILDTAQGERYYYCGLVVGINGVVYWNLLSRPLAFFVGRVPKIV